jgi:cysteinyl-tRNA synthetase
LASAGFDGIYIADANVYAEHRKTRQTAESDMVQLVLRLSARGKAINPEFAVVLANAEELIAHPGIRSAVDAVAKEDLLFGSEGVGEANSRPSVVASLHFLERAQRAGHPVLVAEYLEPGLTSADALKQIRDRGFIGTIAPVAERRHAPLD